MKLNTKEIHGYYINPDSFAHRLEDIKNTAANLNLASVTRIAFNEKDEIRCNTMTKAHLALLEKAILDDHFPIILLEDDCKLIKPFPESFEIPDGIPIIYLGGSTYNCGGSKEDMFIKEYDTNYYRVYNMLSAHAMLIPSIKGANLIINVYTNALRDNAFNDIYLAKESNNSVFLVPKGGNYLYQNDYTQWITNFEWKNKHELLKQ